MSQSLRLRINWRAAIALSVLAAGVAPLAPQLARRAAQIRLTGPNWALWADLPWVVQLHILAALAALGIGAAILWLPKGRGPHKTLGWVWVVAMAATAMSSLFITGLNGTFWSLVHLLSGWTIVALPMGIYAIRNRKLERHKRAMTGLFVGGLLVAGALSFIPGRFMFAFFFG